MKLTWFGGTAIRIHAGGRILVADPEAAPATVDRVELLSGADATLVLSGDTDDLPRLDVASWRPRRARRVLDEGEPQARAEAFRIGPGALLVDADAEAPLLLCGALPEFGRWADGAVAVLFGDGEALTRAGLALLAAARPKMLCVAGPDAAIEAALPALRGALGEAGLMALSPGLAVEA